MSIASKKFLETATSLTLAQATEVAPGVGKRILVTDIVASSDLSGAIITIIEDLAGVPITKFEVQLATGSSNFAYSFKTPIQVSENKSVTVQVNGTALCKANIMGEIISN